MSTATVNVTEIKEKLYERLRPSGWADQLKAFILSEDFDNIIDCLLSLTEDGKRFTPPLKLVFRPFELVPFDEVKVVLMDRLPYFDMGQADGLAYSVNNGSKPFRLMRLLEKAAGGNQKFLPEPSTDLTGWANQGVLLLNASLTTQIGREVSHEKIWTPFLNYVFDILDKRRAGIVFIYPGTELEHWGKRIGPKHHKYFIDDPRHADFDDSDVFNEVNRILLEKGQIIKW